MKTNNHAGNGGVGIGMILTLIFIILKLCGVIHWSWVWVLAPLWISAIVWIIFAILIISAFGSIWKLFK